MQQQPQPQSVLNRRVHGTYGVPQFKLGDLWQHLFNFLNGTHDAPGFIADRIPIEGKARIWVLAAQLDLAHLWAAGPDAWDQVSLRVSDAVQCMRNWTRIDYVWKESGAMNTRDGLHYRYVRLFIKVRRREDLAVHLCRMGVREVCEVFGNTRRITGTYRQPGTVLVERPPAPVLSLAERRAQQRGRGT